MEFIIFRMVSEEMSIRWTFRKRLGYRLDLKNPRTLNEKIQWLKLNDRRPLLPICADKYSVRQYIKEKIGEEYLIPLIFCCEDPKELSSKNLPDVPFVIKCTHDSGGAVIVRDRSDIDWKSIQRQFAWSLKSNYYFMWKEWQYKNIKPRIVVERLLLDENSAVPMDYKLHCFNGRVALIQVDIDRHKDHKRNLYDPDWNRINCRWLYDNGKEVIRPENLSKMKSLAQTIARDFLYVRVDLYNLGSRVFFGELTFHPEAGFGEFRPAIWDRKFGDMLRLDS